MPNLPGQTDPTIESIKEKAESAKHNPRGYLGASEIGEQCARRLYYSFHGAEQNKRRAGLIWAADDGYRSEDIIASRLRSVGVNLKTHDENGEQFGFMSNGFG